MAELFQLRTEQSVNIIEMRLPEHIDSTEFDQLNASLLGLLESKPSKSWVIDFSAVDYLGSAMLGLMVNFRQKVKGAKGKLILCGVSSRLLEIIRTCCMDRLFPIARSRADAIKMSQ
jgi:anti-anti-sigma factor